MSSDTFESIILLHDEDAKGVFKVMDDQGAEAAIAQLKTWHEPGQGTVISTRGTPWKDGDDTFEHDNYVMYYNRNGMYVGLVYRIIVPR